MGAHSDRNAGRPVGSRARSNGTSNGEPRPPVFIIVCKNTALANVSSIGWPTASVPAGFLRPKSRVPQYGDGETNTIIVHSKVVHETDPDAAKSDESRWMRFTLDTVGKSVVADGLARTADLSGWL